jgi:hypothetical protein
LVFSWKNSEIIIIILLYREDGVNYNGLVIDLGFQDGCNQFTLRFDLVDLPQHLDTWELNKDKK